MRITALGRLGSKPSKVVGEPRWAHLVAVFIAAALMSMPGCFDQQPTEPLSPPDLASSASDSGFLRDDFTDADGTLLQNHSPDGGTVQFAWLRSTVWGADAVIENNAVAARPFMDWAYVTSVQTGDQAEIQVEIVGVLEPDVVQEIAIYFRTQNADVAEGYVGPLWSLTADSSFVTVQAPAPGFGKVIQRTGRPSIGVHTLRAEINTSAELEVHIDGAFVGKAGLGNIPPPARTGLATWTTGTPVARITSFSAGPPCPPTGDPNLDDPTNRARFDSSFAASNPDGPQLDRKEQFRAGYRYPDGHVESFDLTPPLVNNCRARPSVPLTMDDGKLIWIWHSHPYEPGEPVDGCLGEPSFPEPQAYPAIPSDADWTFLDELNYQRWIRDPQEPPVLGYIYDKKQAMRMDPNPIAGPASYKWKTLDRSAC